MAITKIVYVDGVTVIRAEQLNAWQDEMIRLDDVKYEKPAGGIPKSDLAAALQTLLDKAQDVEEAAERGDFDGEDGVSPTITVEEITGGHRVTITDAEHPLGQSFDVMDGSGGGEGGGTPGADGYSPVVTITNITGGHRVTITSKAYPQGQTFDVLDGAAGSDGEDGADGSPGPAGADGVSPEISITNITGGHRVTITDASGTRSFDVLDGEDGRPGAQGAPGVSPEVSVETITGGHRVTITDASGTRSFDVMDGASTTVAGILKGDGSGGVSAAVPGTDYQAPEAKIQIVLSASWTGSDPYTQIVTVSGGTANSKVSLQITEAQAKQLIQDGVTFLQINNNAGTFQAVALGAAPSTAMTIQATRVEVTEP